MFTKTEWEELRQIGQREESFDWDIPSGYIVFGTCGMTVHKWRKGRWICKHINDWRNKNYKQVNDELKAQEWREK